MQTVVQERKRIALEEEGLIPSFLQLSASLGERTANAGFGFVRDVHAGTTRGALAAIDFVEALSQSTIATLRSVTQRFSQLSEDALDTGELAVVATIGTARQTSRQATGLMSKTAANLAAPAAA
jgi:hypothetical protein